MGTITIPYSPRSGQVQMHNEIERHRFSVIVAHRRFGKTVAMVNHLLRAAALCELQRPRYGYIAPLYAQAKAVAWDYIKHFTAPIPGRRLNESELWCELPNGARIRLFGADNPDALRGLYFDGVTLDEVAQMKPEVWGEIVRPALADRKGWAVFIGTPKGVNAFHQLYQQAIRDPGWYAGMFRADTSGVISQEELDLAKRSMSDAQFRQEFMCDFAASSEDILISLDLVNEATTRSYAMHQYGYAPLIMGVDVARFGDDRSVIIFRQGLQAWGISKYREMDLIRLAGIISEKITKFKPDHVFIDEVGVGAGVVDYLRSLGYRSLVSGVNAGTKADNEALYVNKRAEMWGNMKQWLLEGGALPDDLELKTDLVSVTYEYDNRSRIKLESKEDMKGRGIPSPDCGDALSLTFAYSVAPADLRGMREPVVETQFNVFS